MYKRELKKLHKVLKEFNEETILDNKADLQKLSLLSNNVNEYFNYKLLDDYCEFLQECNGFEFNGYIIYGTNNLIEMNSVYETISQKDYILIGEYDVGFFAIGIKDNKCYELDKPSGDVVKKFSSLRKMIKYIIINSTK